MEQLKTGQSPIVDKILSTNFALALLIFLANAFGLSTGLAEEAVLLITGIMGFVGTIREALKSAAFVGWNNMISGNMFNYLVAVVATLTPYADQLAPGVKKLFDAILAKDLPQIISAVISLAVMAYYLFFQPNRAKALR